MLEHLEVYINAQKTIANYMIGFGVIMVVLAIVFHFSGANTLFDGLKIGLLVVGFLSLGSGYAYRITEIKLLEQQTELYEESPTKFHLVEKARMDKVVKSFPLYQIVFIAVITICLIVTFFLENNFINGILFSVVIFLLGNMIVEKVSKASIFEYQQHLKE